MRKKFDMQLWIKKVEDARPEVNALVALLQNYGAKTSPENSTIVGVLPYIVKFFFQEYNAVTTIRIIFKDHQTDSDMVITNMTTLPSDKQREGLGSKAIRFILKWARDNNLKDVRATQVSKSDEAFWRKNGFEKADEPNPCNDFVFSLINPIRGF